MLSRSDGFILYGKMGAEFFSTSELLYPNMKISLRLIRARPDFLRSATTPTLALELLIAHSTLDVMLSSIFLTRKKRTWVIILLWNSIIWDL